MKKIGIMSVLRTLFVNLLLFALLIGCQTKDSSTEEAPEESPAPIEQEPRAFSEGALPEEDTKRILSTEYTGTSYSPYAARDFPSSPLWGETHLHTALSIDAGGFGNRLGVR